MSKRMSRLKVSGRMLRKRTRRNGFGGAKQCQFCVSKAQEAVLDYKNINLLRNFLTERGKILPSRISGACCRHQRVVSHNIRKARTMALMPYCNPGEWAR